MRLDRGAIDQHLRRRSASRGQGMEYIRPNPLGGPAHKPIIERLARTIDIRRIRPTAARLQDMDNPADHPTIIDPRLAACVVGKKWLQPRKLLTTKQKYGPFITNSFHGV